MFSPFPKSEKSKEELLFRLLEHKNTIFYICLGYTSDYPQAEELTQEVYLKVWEKIESIETGLNLKAWILTLAKNKCLDHVRREKIRRSFLVDLIARKQKNECPISFYTKISMMMKNDFPISPIIKERELIVDLAGVEQIEEWIQQEYPLPFRKEPDISYSNSQNDVNKISQSDDLIKY